VQKKLKYWEDQVLEEEGSMTGQDLRGAFSKCSRCLKCKNPSPHEDGWTYSHPLKVCSDLAMISLGAKAPYPQPEGLFEGAAGYLNRDRFNQLMRENRTTYQENALLSNFAVFALNVTDGEGALNDIKLAMLNIKLSTDATKADEETWLAGRRSKKQRL
jgi:hypothetical protein